MFFCLGFIKNMQLTIYFGKIRLVLRTYESAGCPAAAWA